MIEWYKKVVFENYSNFKGRARRSEYWYFALANGLISVLLLALGAIIGGLLGDVPTGLIIGYALFLGLYVPATFLPGLAVIVRRLHDVGKSGWFYFIAFIPFIGAIWILILFCTEGTQGPNQYGPDPKNDIEDINEIGKVELQ
ncbi:uncharacterized membrane protein YhaH (DUF805 family) [Flavobacterium sp. 90]|uniref:DUF805 domain-containing protein n=1 Tax=unclassified Flavobacterium TaxID=196869 RepID=UPI000EAFBBDB|nr:MULTISPECIES: DUF805 domain-containing protein [unclassified Flavobacterium]RKR10402.1 uncharacterized membrane protein YhaH (DUF805 family) [Flavobacterium sp. 81]TCK54187.1 uncharacterized membrane protein YhaH (DUF805 family) [Flavobacterium sp. 90]